MEIRYETKIQLIELFNQYDEEELCAFYELFNAYGNIEMNEIVKTIYKRKTGNELTDNIVYDNEELNLEVITNKISELSKNDLLLLNDILMSAKYIMFEDPNYKINKKYEKDYTDYLKISIDIITEFIDNELNTRNVKKNNIKYSEERIEAIKSIINDDELLDLFNKFDVIELEYIKDIFENIQDYDINKKTQLIDYVINKIYKECQEEFSVPFCTVARHPINLQSKNKQLNKNELLFMHMISSLLLNYLKQCSETEDENLSHGYQVCFSVNKDSLNSLENYNDSLHDAITIRNKQLILK